MSLGDIENPSTSSQIARSNYPGNPAWIKGVSGNPVGRPRHVREKLTRDLLSDLANDWAKNGKKAISNLRERDVSTYVRVCVSLVPKEVHVPIGPLDDLSDEELSALVHAARKAVAKANGS